MEKRGLVTREECAADARGSMVRITEAGRRSIAAASPDHVAAVRTFFFNHLTPEEQTQLVTLLTRITTNLPTNYCDE
jgi:DNA-binding MarR family transcriptional regulator